MADEQVIIGIAADLSQMRRDMGQLNNVADKELQKLLVRTEAHLQKVERSVKRHAKKASKDVQDLGKSIKDAGEHAGDADTAIAGLATAVGLISPEAEQAMRSVADLFAGFEGAARGNTLLTTLGASTGGLMSAAAAAAPVVLGLAFAIGAEMDKAEKAAKRIDDLVAATQSLQRAQVAQVVAEQESHIALQQALGIYDEEEAAQRRRDASYRALADARRKEADAVLALAQEERNRVGQTVKEQQASLAALEQAEAAHKRELAEVAKLETMQLARSATIAEVNREKAESEEYLADRAEAQAKTQAAAAEAEAKRLQIAGMLQGAQQARLEGLDAVDYRFQRQLATMRDLGATEQELATMRGHWHAERMGQIAAEEAAVDAQAEANHQATTKAIQKVEEAQAKAAADSEEARKKQIAEDHALALAYAGAMQSVASQTAEAALTIADLYGEKNKEAAKGWFAVYKAAAISQAVISAALAINNVWSQWAGVPWVAAGLTAVTAAATGVQIAAIAAEEPSFHRGTARVQAQGINRAPDEVGANLLQGEAVLNSAAASRLGRANIARMNAGGGGVGPATVVVEHRNRMEASRLRDAQRRQGSPLRAMRAGGRTYGRR